MCQDINIIFHIYPSFLAVVSESHKWSSQILMDCDSGSAAGFRDMLEYFSKVGQILLEEGTIIAYSLSKKRAIMSATFPQYHTLLILSIC